MKPTIYDIAEASNVSIATVSKVLNNRGRISPETRRKVLRAVEVYGYQPSAIASALAGKNTGSVAVLLPDINNPYFSEIVRAIEDEAFARGYSVLVCSTDLSTEREQAYLRTLRQKQMDGIVLATGTTSAETVKELTIAGIRVVVLSREIVDAGVATVVVDNFQGGFMAGRHLLDLGHQRVGYITEPLDFQSARERLRGFTSAFGESSSGLHVAADGGVGIMAGVRLTKQLLGEHSVTALFAANDQLAVGALEACRDLGKRVPDDISLVGFDDTVFARIVQPALTSIAQPIYDMGKFTGKLLVDAVEHGRQPVERTVIEPKLVVRQSTAPKAAD